MYLRSIVNAARAMSYYTRLQEATANNLANVSSEAYKGDRITAQTGPDGEFPVPVQSLDLRQGALRDTGRAFDLALEGDGFLVVQTPNGPRLTRGGSYSLDAAGVLVDRQGDAVMGEEGPLAFTSGNVEIQPDGAVVVDGKRTGRLKLVQVAEPGTLVKEGFGRFIGGGDQSPAANLRVRQGALEDANVDAMNGMIDLLMIQRAWAANIDALKTMDSVLGTVTSDVGRVP